MHSSPAGLLTIAVILMLGACSAPADERIAGRGLETAGPGLTLVDSVVLVEADTAYVGRPVALEVTLDGSLLVSDGFAKTVYRFGRDGQLASRYGGPGGGPGEFRAPTLLSADSLDVAVVDPAAGRLTVFDLESGRVLTQVPLLGRTGDVRLSGDQAWFGLLRPGDEASFANVRLRLRPGSMSDSVLETRFLGAVPSAYHASARMREVLPLTSVDRYGAGFVSGYAGLDVLVVHDDRGWPTRVLDIPKRLRRGVPSDIVQQLAQQIPLEKMASLASTLAKVRSLDSARVALVHMDLTMDAMTAGATAYISVVRPSSMDACVDAPVIVAGDGVPPITFQGDTLYVLDQYVPSDAGAPRSVTVIRRYRIDTSDCEWVPARQVSAVEIGFPISDR